MAMVSSKTLDVKYHVVPFFKQFCSGDRDSWIYTSINFANESCQSVLHLPPSEPGEERAVRKG